MEEKMNIPQDTKEGLLKKAGTVVENIKEKIQKEAGELLSKAKESTLVEKGKEKLEDLKEGISKKL